MYDSTKAELIPTSSVAHEWRGGQAPPDHPYCGYDGDRCVTVTTSISAVNIALALAASLIISGSIVILW